MASSSQQLLLLSGGAAPFTPATLDGVASNSALSNGNLTVTHSNTSTGGGRSTAAKTTGKFYFEVTITSRGGQQDALTLVPLAQGYTNYFSFGIVLKLDTTFFSTQNIYYSGGGTNLKVSPIVNGSIICVAADFTLHKVWFCLSGGLWNGLAIGVENPATGLGGASIPASACAPLLTFEGTGTAAGHNYTVNFGQSAFAGTVPSGFTAGWPA